MVKKTKTISKVFKLTNNEEALYNKSLSKKLRHLYNVNINELDLNWMNNDQSGEFQSIQSS